MFDIFPRVNTVRLPLWLLVFLSLLPLALTLKNVDPPWPGAVGILTIIINPTLVLAFARIQRNLPNSTNRLDKVLASISAIAGLSAYLILLSRYTFIIPTTGEVGVKGFLCTPEALVVYPEDCPGDDREALRSAEFEGPRIWRQWTIDIVRFGLLATWQIMFGGLCWLTASITPRSLSDLSKRSLATNEDTSCYYFMSYSYSDLNLIIPFLDILNNKGYNIWFDKGIPGASAWDEQLSVKLRNCAGVIAFLSPNSLNSKWVQREILLADKLEKPIFCVQLVKCEPHPPLDLLLIRNQVIHGEPHHIANEFEISFGRLSAHK